MFLICCDKSGTHYTPGRAQEGTLFSVGRCQMLNPTCCMFPWGQHVIRMVKDSWDACAGAAITSHEG
jgi:hypothetical protein